MKCAESDEVLFPPTDSLISSLSPCSVAEVAQLCQQHYSYLGWIHWAGEQAWICLNHPLPLPVPQSANYLPWADTDDGKQQRRTSEKQEGAFDWDIIIVSLIQGRWNRKKSADV